MMQKQLNIKTLNVLAMLSALAYVCMLVSHFAPPIVLFLRYDPKDVIIAFGGFLFGPPAAIAMSLTVSLVEMFTISNTFLVGFAMNVISTCAFVCTAVVIYRRKPGIRRAAAGLAAGVLFQTAVMLLWNYFLTPIYMETPRADVAAMLAPVFLPFNLIKGGLNAALTMLIYRPLTLALRKQRLIPAPENLKTSKSQFSIGATALSCFIIITCVIFILILNGVF